MYIIWEIHEVELPLNVLGVLTKWSFYTELTITISKKVCEGVYSAPW